MAKKVKRVKRPYDSPLRREQARATRHAIAESAGRLFADKGYVATSIEDIAAAAGVSRATVFNAVGGKAELLKQAYRLAVRGTDEDTPLGSQPRSRRILAEHDPYQLLAEYAVVVVEIGGRFAPLYNAIRAAGHSDPEAHELHELLDEERRTGAGSVITAISKHSRLREGLDSRTATDLLWVLNDPTLFHLLVHRRRWPVRRFQAWLSDAMQTQLLPPRGG